MEGWLGEDTATTAGEEGTDQGSPCKPNCYPFPKSLSQMQGDSRAGTGQTHPIGIISRGRAALRKEAGPGSPQLGLTVATILLTAAADISSPLGCSTSVMPRYLRLKIIPSSNVSRVSVQFSGSSGRERQALRPCWAGPPWLQLS